MIPCHLPVPTRGALAPAYPCGSGKVWGHVALQLDLLDSAWVSRPWGWCAGRCVSVRVAFLIPARAHSLDIRNVPEPSATSSLSPLYTLLTTPTVDRAPLCRPPGPVPPKRPEAREKDTGLELKLIKPIESPTE